MQRTVFASALALAIAGTLAAQAPLPKGGKGSLFAYWGYNRALFTRSDIHFKGAGYDFTLQDVKAVDRPVPYSTEAYFKPANIWIPQYNYRVGWFLRDQWSLSLGLDHMKYVVVQDQSVRMDGSVSDTRSPTYAMDANGPQDVIMDAGFLQYEHSDGLNLLSVDLDHYNTLWTSSSTRHSLRAYQGLHAGPVIPRTDVRLFGQGINNRFNIAGFGVGAQVGLHFTFLKHLFVRNTLKGGWIDLPHILTTGEQGDQARQHFWYVQHAIVVGCQWRFCDRAAR